MKTKRTFLQWAGFLFVGTLTLVAALIPTGIYATVWWFVPKTFWCVILTILGGLIWLVVQTIWGLSVAMWWDDDLDSVERYDASFSNLQAKSDGDLDISF